MEIYINGFEVGAFAGLLSGTVELPMARAKDNSFMIAYSKMRWDLQGADRVTIKNFAYSNEVKELSLVEDQCKKDRWFNGLVLAGNAVGWHDDA